MRGKVGLVVGLAAGYVLGTRAGRKRYEQIKTQAQKVWELDPVQNQVSKVKDFGTSAALAVPNALWDGAVKITKAVAAKGSAGERVDAGVAAAQKSKRDIADAATVTAEEAEAAAKKAADDIDEKLNGGK
ncbi:hypothetical protein FHX49_001313 [Microbacterium endophyticum]|uniref:YtxH domain-containing protein n=1 Tax=Microbacterium endophyticum TaxID=1526412 RepID=A0A7W4YNJ6_9MICO|nr:hypothetical protein [Microbacterium endophyticum]MBB2975746.1 hypothetical protein [Microbacterium endophyticum]NIK36229.1 hypothetical protein [Microbacterium endophyticum]